MRYTSAKNYLHALLSLLIISGNVYGTHSDSDEQKRYIKEGKKAFKRLRTINFAVIVKKPAYKVIKKNLKEQNVFLLSDISPEKARLKEKTLQQKGFKPKVKIFSKAYDLLKDLLYDQKITTPSYTYSLRKNTTDQAGFLTYDEAIRAGWNDFSLIKLDCFMFWYMASETFQREIEEINKKSKTSTHVVKENMKAYYPNYKKVVNATQKTTKSTRKNSSTLAGFFWNDIANNFTQGLSTEGVSSKHTDHHQGENASSWITSKQNTAFVALSVAAITLLRSHTKKNKNDNKYKKKQVGLATKQNKPLLSDN